MKKTLNVTDGSRSVFKNIILLAWPVFVEQIFTTLVSYADTAMVGSLGAWATASVSISNSVVFMLNGLLISMGVGITALVARAVGAKKDELVTSLIRHALMIIVYIGIPIWLLQISLHRLIPIWMGADVEILDTAARYNLITSCGRIFMMVAMILNASFRGYGDTKTPLKNNLAMNITNVVLNFLLINPTRTIKVFGVSFVMYGAGLEVTGAAIATAAGMFVGGFLALRTAFKKDKEYEIHLTDSFKIDKKIIKQIFSISLPTMLERLCMSSAAVLVASSVATLGTVCIAANTLTINAESLAFMPAFAFQTATTTLVGQCLGAEKPDLAKKYVSATMKIGVVVMSFATVFLYLCAEYIIRFFTRDLQVIAIATECLRILAFIQIPQVVSWIYSGALRGAGDTRYSFYINASTNWFVRTLIAVVAIRVFHFGLKASMISMCLEIIARLILMHLRYKSGKWQTIYAKHHQ